MTALNTSGFPAGTTFPAAANFGTTRMDVLQSELSSGYYTQSMDISALTREIVREQKALAAQPDTGQQPNASSLDTQSILPDWMTSINKKLAKTMVDLGAGNPTSMASVMEATTGAGGSGSYVDNALAAVKKFFQDSAVTILAIVVGLLLLYGAFLTYKK
jgi:hypothetical protein